jgi:hypothetical protein
MYLSQKKDISEGHYPFLLERKPDQVVSVELHQTEEQDLEFILSFVKLEQQYPIYMVMHVPRFMEDDIIEDLLKTKILYEKKVVEKDIYLHIEVKKENQVDIVFQNAYILGCMNQFVSWSFDFQDFIELKIVENEYLFGIFKRKISMPNMILRDTSTFFWIDFDGSSIEIFSTDENWEIEQVKERYAHLFGLNQ